MAKKRVHELARERDMTPREMLERLQAAGVPVKAVASAVDERLAQDALAGRPVISPQRSPLSHRRSARPLRVRPLDEAQREALEDAATDATAISGLEGRELGEFRLTKRIGAGGMAVVYEAVDLVLERPVAVKVLPTQHLENKEVRQRFQREIRTTASLEHPCVVPIYAAGFDEGLFFIAMRLVTDGTLERLLDEPCEHATPAQRVLRVVRQVGSALSYVHERGYVHRDVSPRNVLIWGRGTRHEHALLSDFGIARAVDSLTNLTRGPIGSFDYMAPEVVQWQPATAASDQYGLACVVHFMLVGASPYAGADLPSAHVHQESPRIDWERARIELDADAQRRLQDVLDTAMAKRPNERFGSVAEFVDRVDDVLGPITLAGRTTVRRGVIKVFRNDRRYGFIKASDGAEVFFHQSAFQSARPRGLKPGVEVEFELARGADRPRAVNVRRV